MIKLITFLGSKTKDAIESTLPELSGIANGFENIGTGINDFNGKMDGFNSNIKNFNNKIGDFTAVVERLSDSVDELEEGWKEDWNHIIITILGVGSVLIFLIWMFFRNRYNRLTEVLVETIKLMDDEKVNDKIITAVKQHEVLSQYQKVLFK